MHIFHRLVFCAFPNLCFTFVAKTKAKYTRSFIQRNVEAIFPWSVVVSEWSRLCNNGVHAGEIKRRVSTSIQHFRDRISIFLQFVLNIVTESELLYKEICSYMFFKHSHHIILEEYDIKPLHYTYCVYLVFDVVDTFDWVCFLLCI